MISKKEAGDWFWVMAIVCSAISYSICILSAYGVHRQDQIRAEKLMVIVDEQINEAKEAGRNEIRNEAISNGAAYLAITNDFTGATGLFWGNGHTNNVH